MRPRRPHPRPAIVFVAALILVSLVSCKRTPVGPPTISTIAQFYNDPASASGLGVPVRVTAVVTFYDPDRGLLTVQDSTGAIDVDAGSRYWKVRYGDAVQVVGYRQEGDKLLTHVDVLPGGRSDAVSPIQRSLQDVAEGRVSPQLAVVEAQVRSTYMADGRRMLRLYSQGRKLNALVVASENRDFDSLIDARVRVTGVPAVIYDADGARTGGQLLIARASLIDVVGPAHPLSLPISSLQELAHIRDADRRVRIAGRVATIPSSHVYVIDSGVAIEAPSLEADAGDWIDAAGFLVRTDSGLRLSDAFARAVHHGNLGLVRQPGVLTTARQIRSLTPEKAAGGAPVNVRGVVTYYDPDWQLLFLQDPTGAVFVEVDKLFPVRPGDLVQVQGVTVDGGFAPDIARARISVLHHGGIPNASEPAWEQVQVGETDSKLVRLHGIVTRAVELANRSTITISTEFGPVRVQVPARSPLQVQSLVDRRVDVTGVFSNNLTSRLRPLGLDLYVPSWSCLRAYRAGPDPYSLPAVPIQSLFRYGERTEHRVHVSGTVILRATDGAVYIQDATGLMAVYSYDPIEVTAGDDVEVVGFVALMKERPTLLGASMKKTGSRQLSSPGRMSAEQILRGGHDAERACVRGTLVSKGENSREEKLILKSGNTLFTASSDLNDPTAINSIREGSVIDACGVVLLDSRDSPVGGPPRFFEVRLPSPADIVVVRAASWWTIRHSVFAVIILTAGIVVGVVWLVLLRVRVRRQTEIIQARVQAQTRVEERYRELFENAPDVVYTTDLEGNITSINRAGAQLTGYHRDEIVSMNVSRLLSPESYAMLRPAASAEPEEASSRVREIEVATRWGTRVPMEVTCTPIRQAGRIVGMQTIGRELAQRKQAEEALRHAKEAAEAANRAKSEFLANMSHEIRTPMNGIIGMTELALDTELTSEQREYLRTVQNSAEALLTVINDVLDFSKIEAGKLDFHELLFDVEDLVAEVVKTVALKAHEKDIELILDFGPRIPNQIINDPDRLRQVLLNLVSNAIKFTDHGEVEVRVQAWNLTEGRDVELHFSVRDTGIGIPGDKQGVIFEAFTQADSSVRRHHGGTGLGLAISNRIVQMLGGRIWVESLPGVGSTFHFTAPCALPPMQSETTSAPTEALKEIRTLVVDDNASTRRVLMAMLRDWQVPAQEASDAVDAFHRLQAANSSGTPFRLLLLDAHMPGRDGFQLAKVIRETPNLSAPAVAMLVAGGRADALKCRDAAIPLQIAKPVRRHDLLESILAALGQKTIATSEHSSATRQIAETSKKLRVLLAEDNPVNQQLVLRLLQREGHWVKIVGTGAEAVAAYSADRFDVVLMDLQMPEMDGMQALSAIRGLERISGDRTPIVALTAHAMKGDRERCLAAGMDGYLAKPVHKDELLRALAEFVNSPKIGGATSVPAETVSDTVLDRARALEFAADDERLLHDLSVMFVRNASPLLEALQLAGRTGDFPTLCSLAHKLKGSLSIFGADRALRAALRLEHAGRNRATEEVETRLQTLTAEIQQLILAMNMGVTRPRADMEGAGVECDDARGTV